MTMSMLGFLTSVASEILSEVPASEADRPGVRVSLSVAADGGHSSLSLSLDSYPGGIDRIGQAIRAVEILTRSGATEWRPIEYDPAGRRLQCEGVIVHPVTGARARVVVTRTLTAEHAARLSQPTTIGQWWVSE